MAHPNWPAQSGRNSQQCHNDRYEYRSDFLTTAPDSWENGKARAPRPECRTRSTQQEHLSLSVECKSSTAAWSNLVSERYEKGSLILTSNKSYGDWGTIFADN